MVNLYINSLNTEIKNISAIIFDKDGTLTNSHIYWAEIISLRSNAIIDEFKLNPKYFSLIASSMGLNTDSNNLEENGPIALESRAKVIDELFKKIGSLDSKITIQSLSKIFFEVNIVFKEKARNYIKPINSACEFIQKCKNNNLKLALITSDTYKNALDTINHLKLEDKFDILIGGDSNFGDKKNGKSAQYVCEYFETDPKNVICIGDAPSDHIMSINSNLKASILLETGQIPLKKLLNFSKYSTASLNDVSIQ